MPVRILRPRKLRQGPLLLLAIVSLFGSAASFYWGHQVAFAAQGRLHKERLENVVEGYEWRARESLGIVLELEDPLLLPAPEVLRPRPMRPKFVDYSRTRVPEGRYFWGVIDVHEQPFAVYAWEP